MKVWYAPLTSRMFSGFRSVWMRLRSWRTEEIISRLESLRECALTSYTGKQLPSKALDLRAWKRDEAVSLEEIKDTVAQQICNNADVISVVE